MSRGSNHKALSAIYEVLEADVLQCGEKAELTKTQITELGGERLRSKYARDRLHRDDWPDADQARSAAISGLWCDHPKDCGHSHEDLDEWINCPTSQYSLWMGERDEAMAGE